MRGLDLELVIERGRGTMASQCSPSYDFSKPTDPFGFRLTYARICVPLAGGECGRLVLLLAAHCSPLAARRGPSGTATSRVPKFSRALVRLRRIPRHPQMNESSSMNVVRE